MPPRQVCSAHPGGVRGMHALWPGVRLPRLQRWSLHAAVGVAQRWWGGTPTWYLLRVGPHGAMVGHWLWPQCGGCRNDQPMARSSQRAMCGWWPWPPLPGIPWRLPVPTPPPTPQNPRLGTSCAMVCLVCALFFIFFVCWHLVRMAEKHLEVMGHEAWQPGCRAALGCARASATSSGVEEKGRGEVKRCRLLGRGRKRPADRRAGSDKVQHGLASGAQGSRCEGGARARQVALADASRLAHGSERWQHHQWDIPSGGGGRGPRPSAGVLKQRLPVPGHKRIESLHQRLAPHPCGGWWNSSVGASRRRR